MRNVRVAIAKGLPYSTAMIALFLNGGPTGAQTTPDKPSASDTGMPIPSVEGNSWGSLDVLNDTKGVDLGSYLASTMNSVREKWCRAISNESASAHHKKGQVVIDFAILKDGSLPGMRIVSTSLDRKLDHAAWFAIVTSSPFPALPEQFTGQSLALRFHFFYNTGTRAKCEGGTTAVPSDDKSYQEPRKRP